MYVEEVNSLWVYTYMGFPFLLLWTKKVPYLLFGHQVMSNSFVTPWTVARQAPLAGKNTGVGLPFPSPRDFPDPEIEFMSPALISRFFTTEPPRKPF